MKQDLSESQRDWDETHGTLATNKETKHNKTILDTNLCRNLQKTLLSKQKNDEKRHAEHLPAGSSTKHLSAVRNQEFAALFSGLIRVDDTLSKDKPDRKSN